MYFFIAAAPVARGIATPLVHSHFPVYYLTSFRLDLLAAGGLPDCVAHAAGSDLAQETLGGGGDGNDYFNRDFAVCVLRIPNFPR